MKIGKYLVFVGFSSSFCFRHLTFSAGVWNVRRFIRIGFLQIDIFG